MFSRRASEARHAATVPDRGRGAGPVGRGAREDADPRSARPGRLASERGPAGAGVAASPGGAEQEREVPERWGPPPAGLDVSTPHPARVRNYWLGGRDFFAADKAAAEEIGREVPHLAETARAEGALLVLAGRFLAGPARILQYLDVGAGLPAGGNTHEIAQRIAPESAI